MLAMGIERKTLWLGLVVVVVVIGVVIVVVEIGRAF
jgi:hypothetical protein